MVFKLFLLKAHDRKMITSQTPSKNTSENMKENIEMTGAKL